MEARAIAAANVAPRTLAPQVTVAPSQVAAAIQASVDVAVSLPHFSPSSQPLSLVTELQVFPNLAFPAVLLTSVDVVVV